jgi:uncharacterized protein (DUF1501 family)
MTSNGVLTYEYQNRAGTGDVVSELALLLTGGREPPAIRAYWEQTQKLMYNIALNRPTTASSEWHGGAAGPANIADGDLEDASLFHSLCDGEQWVQVDLEAVTVIDSVKIYHRTSCCSDRINGAIVLVSNTPDFSTGVQCAAPLVFTGAPSGTLSCPGTSGRYVTVRQQGQCLQVRELQVLVPGGDGVEIGATCTPPPAFSLATAASGYLCPAGTVGVPQEMCLQATLAVMPAGWAQARTHLIVGNWGFVSPGCAPQATETDFAAHFNTNGNAGGSASFPQACMLAEAGAVRPEVDGTTVSPCDAVTALEDDAACVALGCSYTPALAPAFPVPSAADLLPTLIKLFTFSPEYAATNLNTLREHPRPALPEIPTQNRPYKAIVVLFLEGGADSFNMLIPHSGCARDLYAEYAEVRSNIALPLSQILPMDLHEESAAAQPCSTFGTHPALGMVKTLWDAGHAAWFANIGSLVEPTTRDQFVGRTGRRPPGLFGHDSQQRQCQSVHAQNTGANGVLGRIVEALTAQATPYRSKVYSIYGIRKLVEGDVPPTVIGKGGVIRFSQYNDLAPNLHAMTDRASDSLFADTYAEILESSLVSTQRLGVQMGAVNLLGSYSGGTGMEQIARVMSLDHSVHESERDVFMVGVRTFDAHQNAAHMDINMLLGGVNADLEALHTDLVALDLWDSTTIVSISDFGRTLTSNGIGTDHAWGGNNFLLGGAVKGRRIHGQFPEDLNPATSELEVGRGRGIFVPTTPWEGMWYGVAEWFGVEADRLYDVVPNAANFPDSAVHTAEELYN